MRVCLLASGSKGNAILVDSGGSKILVDAGLAATEIVNRLATVGIDGTDLDGILISHEHTDHVRGAGTLARRFKIPVLVSYPTHNQMGALLRKTEVIEFEAGYPFTFRDILIDPFPITHDACDPVGFAIECGDGKVGIATDLGIATRLVENRLKGCRIIVLESNHDEEMLRNGPYPWHLKQRIRSRHGHLSNDESAELLEQIIHPDLEGVFLAHLSETNNDPEVAFRVASAFLAQQNVCSPTLVVTQQHAASRFLAV